MFPKAVHGGIYFRLCFRARKWLQKWLHMALTRDFETPQYLVAIFVATCTRNLCISMHFHAQQQLKNQAFTQGEPVITGVKKGLKIRRPLRSWGFDPPSRHQDSKGFTKEKATQREWPALCLWMF